MKSFTVVLGLALSLSVVAHALPDDALSDDLRMNEIQIIGTHNSYHQRPDDDKLEMFRQFDPQEAASWEYSHPPLINQLEAGIRSFELDLNYYQESWSVFHVPNVDENSSCREFTECLKTIRTWSEANPTHVPIILLFEIKEGSAGVVGLTEEITDAALHNLEKTVRETLPQESLITPATVQGAAPTMSKAIKTVGWPTLRDSRGKIAIVLLEKPGIQKQYLALFDQPGEALFFTFNLDQDGGEADFTVLDSPLPGVIQPWVKNGFIVRTRADAGLKQGRMNDIYRREAAFASGAQIVCTDFPPGEGGWRSFETKYVCTFPDGTCVRPNPLLVEE